MGHPVQYMCQRKIVSPINLKIVSSLWSSGTAVEVHADGPVSIPIASKDEDILHGPY